MNLRLTSLAGRSSRRSPAALRRPTVFLTVAASGALLVSALSAGAPAAHAGSASAEPVSVASELGLTASVSSPSEDALRPLQSDTASRSLRADGLAAASLAQSGTDAGTLRALATAGHEQQHVIDVQKAKAAAAAAAKARAAAAAAAAKAQAAAQARAAAQAAAQAQAAARARAAQQAAAAAAPVASAAAPAGSYQNYALQKVGQGQFSCLESLWGRESGWNPNAANPSSTAYGIPQFLDSTWASTGIGKTSNGYRQIDAGLIYIDSRYGSPCGAWSHSQNFGWY